MPFPTQAEIEIPLLKVINSLGGACQPRQTYPQVARYFPLLTEEEQNQRLENYPNIRKWWNMVQWARQRCVENGEISATTRGIWKITDAGRQRIQSPEAQEHVVGAMPIPPTIQINLRDLSNEQHYSVRKRIIDELNALTPYGFEKFCISLLEQLGYENLQVTQRTGDSGIDGNGDFRQGVVSMKSAFQAKRWSTNSVGRPEIQAFRGAIQGEFDHGVFLTTSRFTGTAQEESIRRGVIPVLLLDGDSIANLMIEKGLGVRKQPIYLVDIDEEFFDFDEE